jgi:hypothetical protein
MDLAGLPVDDEEVATIAGDGAATVFLQADPGSEVGVKARQR